jgi:peptidoglycan/LPS O-acetylase OafA/YrhL
MQRTVWSTALDARKQIMDKNNFDGVRIVLALIVVFAHISALTTLPEFHYFATFFDSNFAVKGFFAVSGFLVTKSFVGCNSLIEFAEKRFRRIYPAYTASLLLCLVIGIATSSLAITEFLSSPETIKYLFANLAFLNFLQPELPYVFDDNPMRELNGSLWTIKIEVMLYCCTPLIVYLFSHWGSLKTTAIIFVFSVTWVYFFKSLYTGNMGEVIARQFPGQISYFVVGALFAINTYAMKKLVWITLLSTLGLFILHAPLARLLIEPIAYSSIVIYCATKAARNFHLGRYGDISYGIYLYHFPIIQLLIHWGLFALDPWLGLTLSLIITLGVALLSWHFVEKPFLKRSSHYLIATKS